jgi:hypothetical protein
MLQISAVARPLGARESAAATASVGDPDDGRHSAGRQSHDRTQGDGCQQHSHRHFPPPGFPPAGERDRNTGAPLGAVALYAARGRTAVRRSHGDDRRTGHDDRSVDLLIDLIPPPWPRSPVRPLDRLSRGGGPSVYVPTRGFEGRTERHARTATTSPTLAARRAQIGTSAPGRSRDSVSEQRHFAALLTRRATRRARATSKAGRFSSRAK